MVALSESNLGLAIMFRLQRILDSCQRHCIGVAYITRDAYCKIAFPLHGEKLIMLQMEVCNC